MKIWLARLLASLAGIVSRDLLERSKRRSLKLKDGDSDESEKQVKIVHLPPKEGDED